MLGWKERKVGETEVKDREGVNGEAELGQAPSADFSRQQLRGVVEDPFTAVDHHDMMMRLQVAGEKEEEVEKLEKITEGHKN